MVSLGLVQRAIISPLSRPPRDQFAQIDTYVSLQQIAVGNTICSRYTPYAWYEKHTSFTHIIDTKLSLKEQ